MLLSELFENRDYEQRDFLGVSTSTPGKERITNWAEKHTKDQVRESSGLCVYLVGDAKSGLERHINEKIKLGFTNLAKHVIVEKVPSVHQELLNHQQTLQTRIPDIMKIQIIKGDLFKIANQYPSGSIAHLDYDGTMSYNKQVDQGLKSIMDLGITNIHVVISARAGKFFKDVYPAEQHHDLWHYDNRDGKYKPNQRKCITRRLKDLSNNRYDILYDQPQGYFGRSNMLMFVLNKK